MNLRVDWEETSYRLELLQVSTCNSPDTTLKRESIGIAVMYLYLFQANPDCVQQEWENVTKRATGGKKGPKYFVSFDTTSPILKNVVVPRVAIVREEGSNGDREMAAAFQAGIYHLSTYLSFYLYLIYCYVQISYINNYSWI